MRAQTPSTRRIYVAVFLLFSVFAIVIPRAASSADLFLPPVASPPAPLVITSADKILYGSGTTNGMFTINADGTERAFLGAGV